MSKINKWIEEEKNVYYPCFIKIMNGITSTNDFMTDKEKSIRPYRHAGISLTHYLDTLEAAEKTSGKWLTSLFIDSKKIKETILDTKSSCEQDLQQCIKCSKCKCLDCTLECQFKACYNCKGKEYVFSCDKNNNCVIKGMKEVKLINDTFNSIEQTYEVIGKLINKKDDKEYVLLVDKSDKNNSQLQNYVKNLDGTEEYISIKTDKELDRIYNIFLSLGCSDS